MRWMILAAVAIATPALAQDAAEGSGEAPRKVRSVVLFGDQQCPKSTDPDEIVVCSSGGESPYRIPPKLRETPFNPANQSWAARAEGLREVNRIGLPNSCSPVGLGGQTGCNADLREQWAAERRANGQAPGLLRKDPDDE
jgi:hypothetical protein